MELFKFTSQMKLVGYLPLGQVASTFDRRNQFLLTVNDDYLHIAGTGFRQDVPTGVSQHISQVHTFSLLKIKDEGWLPAEDPGRRRCLWLQAFCFSFSPCLSVLLLLLCSTFFFFSK